MACGDEGLDFDSDFDFDPDKPLNPYSKFQTSGGRRLPAPGFIRKETLHEVSYKRGPPARLRSASCAAAGCAHPDLSGQKLGQSGQRSLVNVHVNVHVLVRVHESFIFTNDLVVEAIDTVCSAIQW